MNVNKKLEEYIHLMRFLSETLSPDTELVLYDIVKRKVAHVENSFDSEMVVGSSIRALERKLIAEKMYISNDYIVNYRSLSVNKQKLKSATYFIKDKSNKDKLVGILTININVDKLIEFRDLLDSLISGPKQEENNNTNILNMTFEELMETTIREAISSFNLPPDRLTHEEKLELISNLDKKGVFKVKGAVTELAQLLGMTETSIYRYINKI